MKMRKVISAFLVLICLFATFGLCTLGASAAEGARTVYATTSTSIKQGSYGYLYVYLDDLTDLSALNVSVYYDTEKITVKSVYNQVPSVVNDLATGDGCVNASYIFDGKGTAAKTNLFYIYYQVNNTAEIGDTYFDIVVNEAYNSSLEGMDFTGSRCSLEITEKTVTKSCSITSSSTVSTSVGEEFELSYRLSTYQIASGSMNIQYDPELFEVVSVTNGGFLTDKIADINTSLDGTIAISFVGTTYQSKYDVVKVRFKTLKNVTETSDIKLVVTDLYDKELNLYSCSGYTTKASIAFDESYTEDAPSMSVSSSYNSETGKVTATIKLEKDSMLGAGDFVLKFDTRYLTYISAEKGFSPTFFNINDKDSVDGVLKFSIISLSDITDEQIILTVVFDVKHYCQDKTADFEISGSGLTDSLVNTIQLNFVDASILIPLKHTAASAVEDNRVEPTCTGTGSYDSVIYCSVCNAELSREEQTIAALGHAYSPDWTVDLVPTCTESGSKSHHCDRCGYKTGITEIPANGHSFGKWYEVIAPTCVETGLDEQKCSVCGHTERRVTEALGHTPNAPVVENRVDPTCTEQGSYDSVVYCSVCNEELTREEKTIDALGHTPNAPVVENRVAPTCTEQGSYDSVVYCSVCSAELFREKRTIDALGHKPGEPVVENSKASTCTEQGSYDSVVYCSVCNAELTREEKTIAALGHAYSPDWTVDLVPSCTESGSKSHHCDRCGYKTEITEIPANGHSFGKWYEVIAPTCVETGLDEQKCAVCGHAERRVTEALGHISNAPVVENRVDPTCTEQGSYDSVVYCSVCNAELTREEKTIDLLGHNYNAVVTAPTCIEKGYTTHTCSRCNDTYVDIEVAELGHKPSAEADCLNDQICTVCCEVLKDKLGHDYNAVVTAPTCTEKGYTTHTCSRCNDSYTDNEVNALDHKPGTEADCLKDQICTVCGEVLVEKLCHNYNAAVTAPTCTEKGYTAHTCSRCNDSYIDSEVDALGHTPSDWIVDQEPAPGIEGAKYKTCTVCGETLETAVIDALPVETEPKIEPATEPETETPTEIPTDSITEPSLESDVTTDEETNADTEKAPQKNGCSGSIYSYASLLLLILAVMPLYIKTKKENE